MGIGDEFLRLLRFGDFYFMRDVGHRRRGLAACWTFVPYLVRWSEERSSLGRDIVKTSSVFSNITLVYGVFIDYSILLA